MLLYLINVSNVRQIFAANDFNRRHFQMHFFLGALRVNILSNTTDPDEMQQKVNLIRVCSVIIFAFFFGKIGYIKYIPKLVHRPSFTVTVLVIVPSKRLDVATPNFA